MVPAGTQSRAPAQQAAGVLIEDLPITEVPKDLTGDWQLVRLASGRNHVMFKIVVAPPLWVVPELSDLVM
jgi:hypothetical protein